MLEAELVEVLAKGALAVGQGEEPSEGAPELEDPGLPPLEGESEEPDSVSWLLELLGKTRVPTEDEQLGYLGLARLGREAAQALEERTGIPKEAWRVYARHRLLDREPPSFLKGLEEKVPKEAKRLYHQLLQGEEGVLRMVEGNLKLVLYVAKSYAFRGGPSLNELVNEGVAGLYEAVDRFDPKLGYRFSTYAYWWIRQRVGRNLGRAKHPPPLRLEEPVSEEATLGDFLHADTDLEGEVLNRRTLELFRKRLLEVLGPLRAAAVFLKYGLGDGEPSSNAKVAKALGLSQAEVAQLLEESKRRLRFALTKEVEDLALL